MTDETITELVKELTEEEKKGLMISCSGKFLDEIEVIMNNVGFTSEEKGDFMVNTLAFMRGLFIHASHEQMKLKNEDKWNTLKVIQEMDRVTLRTIMQKDKPKYNH
jgi:hypothetical protein